MTEFFIKNYIDIIVVVVFAATMIALTLRGKRTLVYKILYYLVTEAERLYGSGSGALKLAYVVERAYGILPPVIKAFITYERLAEMIEKALAEAKLAWAREAGIVAAA